MVIGLQLGFKIIQAPDQIISHGAKCSIYGYNNVGALTVPHMILINKSKYNL